MSHVVQVLLGLLANIIFDFLKIWQGQLFVCLVAVGLILWRFHTHPITRLALNWLTPAFFAILLFELPRYLYSDWVACLVPWLPQPEPPCLLVQARLDVVSIVDDFNSRQPGWYMSLQLDGKSEIVSTFDDAFTGKEEFLAPAPVLRKFWKGGRLVASDEIPSNEDHRYAWVRFYYLNGCGVIAADYAGVDGRTIASGWDPTCSGNPKPLYSDVRLPVPTPIFLPFRY